MTPEQYTRWHDFATRMARTCFPDYKRPSTKWIINKVIDFFDDLDPDDIPAIRNWDNSDPDPDAPRFYGRFCIGDQVSCFLDNYRPYAPRCRACEERIDLPCRCDEKEEACYNQWDDQWGSPVACCIRAGLDMASAPSAGVLGFTKQDLENMYPEGVPEWVTQGDKRWYKGFTNELNGTYAEMSPDTYLVL